MQRKSPDDHAADGQAAQPKIKRRRASKAVTLAEPAAPPGLPALIERVAASVSSVDDLAKLLDLKRQFEADAERLRFDQDFASLQAELSPVAANSYDQQKRRSYADINALVDAVGPLAAAKGFGLTYDAEPSSISGAVKVTVKLLRSGIERTASADVPMDGAGMRGGANMSAPQGYGSSLTYGRKLALTLMFNLTVSAPQKAAEPPQRQPERHPPDDPPPWDEAPRSDADHLEVLKRAAARSNTPATDKQLPFLADLMRKRGERPEAVLEPDGSLSSRAAGQAIDARRGGR